MANRPPGRSGRAGTGPTHNRPNSGASVGGTGRGTSHKGGGGKPPSGCGKKSIIAIPMVLFYGLPMMFIDYRRAKRAS